MKTKTYLLILLMGLAQVSLSAKDIFSLKSGDPMVLLQDGKKAIYRIDYSEMMVTDSKNHDNDMLFKEWMISQDEDNDKWTTDWIEKDSASCDKAFREGFNDEVKKSIKLSKVAKDYSLTLRLTMIDFGSAVKYSPIKGITGGNASATGEIVVKDYKTGEVLLILSFEELKGEGSMKQIGRLKGVFENLGENLNDYLKGYKKSQKKKDQKQ